MAPIMPGGGSRDRGNLASPAMRRCHDVAPDRPRRPSARLSAAGSRRAARPPWGWRPTRSPAPPPRAPRAAPASGVHDQPARLPHVPGRGLLDLRPARVGQPGVDPATGRRAAAAPHPPGALEAGHRVRQPGQRARESAASRDIGRVRSGDSDRAASTWYSNALRPAWHLSWVSSAGGRSRAGRSATSSPAAGPRSARGRRRPSFGPSCAQRRADLNVQPSSRSE